MKVFDSLNLVQIENPVVVTIGSFDGVHLGHEALLNQSINLARKIRGICCVVTFSNHPMQVFKPHFPFCRLCDSFEKIKRIEALGCDVLISLKFTKEFAALSAEQFLTSLVNVMPVKQIVLGYDALIGKNREGDRREVLRIAELLGFTAVYLDPFSIDGIVVSSTAIREAIKKGDFLLASKLLGRPYSISYPSCEKLYLPEDGDYRVLLTAGVKVDIGILRIQGGEVLLPHHYEPCEIIFL